MGGETKRILTVAVCTIGATAAVGAADTVAAPGEILGRSTVSRQILPDPPSGFDLLRTGKGSGYVIRGGSGKGRRLGRARPGRAKRRTSISYFGQLSDFQIADEESPARLEYLAAASPDFKSGWRPGEALTVFQADRMIRQFNHFATRPPHRLRGRRRARMDFVINTGDLADSNQLNEARWNRRLLEGGWVRPGSGVDPAPHLGRHRLCPTGLAPRLQDMDPAEYAGVQDHSLWSTPAVGYYWDPDRPGPDVSPDRTGLAFPYAKTPGWPGLMNRAQQPFKAVGLKVPGYVAFGNHDRLMQGIVFGRKALDRLATGCLKPVGDSKPDGSRPDPLPGFADLRRLRVNDLLSLYRSSPASFMAVPPDPARRMLTERDFIRVFRSGRDRKTGHGFGFLERAERKASRGFAGYYSFSPRRRIRFVVLDTTSSGVGRHRSYQGNLDHPQFRWFARTLRRATRQRQLVVVFSHHAIPNLTAGFRDELAPSCRRVNPRKVPGCDGDPRRSTPIHLAADTRRLMLRYPNAIAWVAGHSHANRIDPYVTHRGRGGFWSIQTSSLAEWPAQNRLIELFDNHDGTLSIFGTLLDHAAPASLPAPGQAAGGFTPTELASIGRTLSYNDVQTGGRACPFGRCHRVLLQNRRGNRPRDRNVELLIRDPRR